MAEKRTPPPSPLQAGINHAAISFVTFTGIAAAGLGAIHFMGSDERASPREVVALFSEEPLAPLPLKDRINIDDPVTAVSETVSDDEPSLGVADPTEAVATPATAPEKPAEVVKVAEEEPQRLGLPKAPIEGVYEWGSEGRLPKISDDGRRPFDVYKRPFSNPAGRPTVSIVLGGLGLNRRVTQAAIDELPPEVTLSFVPYSRGLQTWIDRARAAGHEVLIEFPMEPYDYPNNDPGPYTLLTTANAPENKRRAEWLLSQATGYFGVANYQGAKFATDTRAMSPVFDMLSERGLAFVHDGAAPRSVFETVAGSTGLPFAESARVIDAEPVDSAIDEQLLHLEAIALQRGYALGTGFGFPVTVDQIRDWTATLDSKGYVLAPASALTRMQPAYGGPTEEETRP